MNGSVKAGFQSVELLRKEKEKTGYDEK